MCALVKEEVEIPSDFEGVVYVIMDASGSWRTQIVRELQAAGFDVDGNRAL